MEEVAGYLRALRHPVQPEPQAGPVDVVVGDDRINGGVELDTGHLGPGEEPADVDVVDGVAGDGAERGAEAADDARLLAVRNGVVADAVVANVLSGPGDRIRMGALDGLYVALCGVGRGVVILVAVFAEGAAGGDR